MSAYRVVLVEIFLRELTGVFSQTKAATGRALKTSLTQRMHVLQRLFETSDNSAFTELCRVQMDLRAFAVHEARGAQVRARCQGAEEGETSSSYFFGLEAKHCARQTVSSIRDPVSGHVRHDPFEILGVWQRYYASLFTAQVCDPAAQDDLLQKVTRRVTSAERAACEDPLTVDECLSALSGMTGRKTPGSDGFPMEFYLRF